MDHASPRQPDPLARFYTNCAIGRLLVQSVASNDAKSVLELGAGAGALTAHAGNRWLQADITTVDVDLHSARVLSNFLATRGIRRHRHFHNDVFDAELPSILDERAFDAAICNPPYTTPVWRPDFVRILSDAGFDNAVSLSRVVPAHLLFIAQNLRMLRNGGHLALIVPDSLISGCKFAAIRESLLRQCSVDRVIQLPRHAFRHADVQTHIMVLRKGEKTSTISLQKLGGDGNLSHPIHVSSKEAYERLDYNHYQSNDKGHCDAALPSYHNLREAGAMITRGRLNSAQIKQIGFPVFDTRSFPDDGSLAFDIPAQFFQTIAALSAPNATVAQPGDILIARVGRRLHQKVCFVRTGNAVIADTVFRIRVPGGRAIEIARELSSSRGSDLLLRYSRGTGARFISLASMMNLSIVPA